MSITAPEEKRNDNRHENAQGKNSNPPITANKYRQREPGAEKSPALLGPQSPSALLARRPLAAETCKPCTAPTNTKVAFTLTPSTGDVGGPRRQ